MRSRGHDAIAVANRQAILGMCGRGSRCPGELLTSIAILELAELLEELNAPVVAQTCATGHFFRLTFAEHFF
jgi:hypothetical protein